MARSQCDRTEAPTTPHSSDATLLQASCLLTFDNWEHLESQDRDRSTKPKPYFRGYTPPTPFAAATTYGLYKLHHIEESQHPQVALSIGLTPLREEVKKEQPECYRVSNRDLYKAKQDSSTPAGPVQALGNAHTVALLLEDFRGLKTISEPRLRPPPPSTPTESFRGLETCSNQRPRNNEHNTAS
jgi:hypothetical protein